MLGKKAISVLLTVLFLSFPVVSRGFCFREAGEAYDVSSDLLEAISLVESNNDPLAHGRNSNGTEDYGLMQVNSSWARAFGGRWSLVKKDPCYNVMAGAWILRSCIDRYGEDWKAVECYHTGKTGGTAGKRYVSKVVRALVEPRRSR